MRITVLHQHYWPEIAATAQILTDLCEELARRGHDVSVITGQPSYRNSRAERLPRDEVRNEVHIRRVWSYVARTRSVPGRLASYGSYFLSSFAAALRQEPDVLLVMSTPPLLLGLSGAMLRAFRGIPFVYSVQDLYPDIAIEVGVLKRGLLSRVIDQVANRLYRAAASVVTISDAMALRLLAKGVPSGRITVIPNWADTDLVYPSARDNAFGRAHGLTGRFVVLYSGNIGLSQGLEFLPDAAAELTDLPISFAVVGDGNARPHLEALVAARGLRNVLFLPPQPRACLGDLLASSDLGLVTMRRGVASSLVPSKLYGIMAAGRPVLAAVERESEVARVIDAHRCGLIVPPEDPRALAAAIRLAHGSRQDLTAMGTAAREACLTHYSRSACAQRYDAVFRMLEHCATDRERVRTGAIEQ